MSTSPDYPPLNSTVFRIRSRIHTLIPSEQRVAQEIVDFPEAVTEISGADLAARTGTSAATVSRTCQNLGYQGFQHLKVLLIRETIVRSFNTVDQSNEDLSPLTRAAQLAAEAVGSTFINVDETVFSNSVEVAASAGRILIIGAAGSVPVAQILRFRFIAAGIACEAPEDSVLQNLSAKSLSSEDVCIVISQSGSNPVSMVAAESARDAGAAVIGFTAFTNSPITKLANYPLITGFSLAPDDPGAVKMNLVTILFVSMWQVEVLKQAHRKGGLREDLLGVALGSTLAPAEETPEHRTLSPFEDTVE